jgi:hypothetical protein
VDPAEAVLTPGEGGWQEMWGYVRRAHKILEETTSAPAEHSDLRAEAMTFFILCYHLVDWIDKDKTNRLERNPNSYLVRTSRIPRVSRRYPSLLEVPRSWRAEADEVNSRGWRWS